MMMVDRFIYCCIHFDFSLGQIYKFLTVMQSEPTSKFILRNIYTGKLKALVFAFISIPVNAKNIYMNYNNFLFHKN